MRLTPGLGPGTTVWLAVASIVEAEAAGTTRKRSAAQGSRTAMRRVTRATLVGSDRVPHGPERLLDVYRRHARHGDGEQHHLAGALRHPDVRPGIVEEDHERPRPAGDDQPPAR